VSNRPALRIALPVIAVVAFITPQAQAQERQEVMHAKHHTYESPQYFAVELRVGPYYPEIDSDPALHGTAATGCSTSTAGPAATVFGTSNRAMVSAEFDWQALRIPHLGTLGPGASIGYTYLSGQASFQSPHVTSAGSTCTSGESTSLTIIPMYVVGVLRADVLWRELRIPLVPYVKAGVGYALWRASNDLGTSNANGVSGEGHTWGTQLAVGIAFNLNILDEYAAKNFDEQLGVNNTYAFAEYMWSNYRGLGLQSDPLRVGDLGTWVAGLAWEF
jgi:hypothetical protein